jgi:hypothetical protein
VIEVPDVPSETKSRISPGSMLGFVMGCRLSCHMNIFSLLRE